MTSTTSPAVRITQAEFRPATQKDIEEVKGNWLWRSVTYPLSIVTVGLCKVLGTWEIFSHKNNVLAWDTPKLQQLGEGVSKLKDRVLVNFGFEEYRNRLYFKTLFSFMGDRYFVDDKVIMEAFFKYHRKEQVWNGTPSLNRFINLVKKMFPEETFTQDDFMFSCSKERTDQCHSLLKGLIETDQEKFNQTIEQIASDTVDLWFDVCKTTGKAINITEATRTYAAQVIAKRIFNVDSNKETSEAMDFLSNYVVNQQAGKLTPQDQNRLTRTFNILRSLADKVLLNQRYFDPERKLSNAQKKAMVINLIFAGQEATASLLSYIIWKLARAPKFHNVPGKSLAKSEIEILVKKLVSKYEISTQQNKDIDIVGIVTSRLEEDIYMTLKQRK